MTTTTSKLGADMTDDTIDAVSKALRRAWQLGQTYWQQADSDSYKQRGKSDETRKKFEALVDETRAILARQPAAIGKEAVTPVRIADAERAAYEVSGHRAGEKWTKAFAEALLATPLAKEASKPAPSVEQDERGAVKCRELALDDMDQLIVWLGQHERDEIGHQGLCDLIVGAFAARTASTSANVAQGAKTEKGESDA